MNTINKRAYRVSTGLGTTICSFYYPNSRDLIYSGSFHHDKLQWNPKNFSEFETCPIPICRSVAAKKDPILHKICKIKIF